MRKLVTMALLASALAGAGIASVAIGRAGAQPARQADDQAGAAGRRAAAAPAAAADARQGQAQVGVPVKQVVLFSSGVGYFEHFGTVQGNGSTELRFKTQQINDMLKSLVLQDLDGGMVTTVTYPSQDPVAKTLRSFQVDIYSNPSLAELLNQLRGAKVTLTTGQQERVSGTVLGVEKKQRPVGGGGDKQVIETPVLNLLVGAGIRSLEMEQVKDIQIDDPQLREELEKALAALAQARDQDKKPVTINFRGRGDRRVRVGYVVETPIWKTSYRLILSGGDGPAGAGAEAGAGVDEDQPRRPRAAAANRRGAAEAQGAAEAGGAAGKLQGWAIVENQTDSDWNDVQLSLVSGRPISFIQDLYQPLYIPRPVVQPQLYASLNPQTYDAGMEPGRPTEEFAAKAPAEKAKELSELRRSGLRVQQPEMLSDLAPSADEAGGGFGAGGRANQPIDASASVSSVASAAKVGELFQYTVGSVSLPRQKSAMIPIVTDDVEVERLSIYNPNVLPKNPLNGARVKNTTGKHLLQGPVTVLDGGAYAGDARIDDVPPGQERLLSYGIDLQVLVNATAVRQESTILTGKVVKGVLHLTHKQTFAQEYAAENKGEKDKALLIEHPLRQGWKLVEPAKADETTEAVYRFKGKVAAGKGTKLTVREELVHGEAIAILPADVGALEFYSKTGQIPQAVRDALARAVGMKHLMVDTQRQIQERQQRMAEITAEQNRIRENMKTVAQDTDYYKRLLTKLDEQETAIEKLQKEVEGLQKKFEVQRKDLEDYLAGLDVG